MSSRRARPFQRSRNSFALRSISFEPPPARHRLEVIEHALVAVVHLVACLAGPQAQVGVLEAVAEGLVEAADGSNVARRTSMHAAVTAWKRRDTLTAGCAGREARVQMARVAVLADHDPGVLDRLVREQQLGAHDARRAGCASAWATSASSQPATGIVSLLRNTSSSPRAASAPALQAPGEALRWHRGAPPHPVAVARQQPRRVVLGGVVDHDQLERDRRRLGQDRVEALAGEPGAAVHRDHDRAARRGRFTLTFRSR